MVKLTVALSIMFFAITQSIFANFTNQTVGVNDTSNFETSNQCFSRENFIDDIDANKKVIDYGEVQELQKKLATAKQVIANLTISNEMAEEINQTNRWLVQQLSDVREANIKCEKKVEDLEGEVDASNEDWLDMKERLDKAVSDRKNCTVELKEIKGNFSEFKSRNLEIINQFQLNLTLVESSKKKVDQELLDVKQSLEKEVGRGKEQSDEINLLKKKIEDLEKEKREMEGKIRENVDIIGGYLMKVSAMLNKVVADNLDDIIENTKTFPLVSPAGSSMKVAKILVDNFGKITENTKTFPLVSPPGSSMRVAKTLVDNFGRITENTKTFPLVASTGSSMKTAKILVNNFGKITENTKTFPLVSSAGSSMKLAKMVVDKFR